MCCRDDRYHESLILVIVVVVTEAPIWSAADFTARRESATRCARGKDITLLSTQYYCYCFFNMGCRWTWYQSHHCGCHRSSATTRAVHRNLQTKTVLLDVERPTRNIFLERPSKLNELWRTRAGELVWCTAGEFEFGAGKWPHTHTRIFQFDRLSGKANNPRKNLT